jgi:hypothetical protein
VKILLVLNLLKHFSAVIAWMKVGIETLKDSNMFSLCLFWFRDV